MWDLFILASRPSEWKKHEQFWFLPKQPKPPKGFKPSRWVRPLLGIEEPHVPLKPEEATFLSKVDNSLVKYADISPIEDPYPYLPLEKSQLFGRIAKRFPDSEHMLRDIIARIQEQKGTKKSYQYDVTKQTAKEQIPYWNLGKDQDGFGHQLSLLADEVGWPNPVESYEDEEGNTQYRVPGYIKDPRGRTTRLSKLLKQIARKVSPDAVEITIKDKQYSPQEFAKLTNDVYSSVPKITDWQLVVSAEPSDILMMSTGKGWQSCVTEGECNFSSLDSAVSSRDMVAYAVAPGFDNWISRVWLRSNGKGKWWPEPKVYGTTALDDKIFLKAVVEYLQNHGIYDENEEYGPESKGFSDKLLGLIQFKTENREIKRLKEKEIEKIPYVEYYDIEETTPYGRMPKDPVESKYTLFVDLNADLMEVEAKLEALLGDNIFVSDNETHLHPQTKEPIKKLLFVSMHPQFLDELTQFPEIIGTKYLGPSDVVRLIVNPNIKAPLSMALTKVERDLNLTNEQKTALIRNPFSFPNMFPQYADRYEEVVKRVSSSAIPNIVRRIRWIDKNIRHKVDGDKLIFTTTVKKAPSIMQTLQGDGHQVQQTKNAFYLSKRELTASEYVKKKKEDSGNITYIYDEKHVEKRNKDKAKKVGKLAKSISNLRKQIKKDIDHEDIETALPALAVALIDETYERVGNRYSAQNEKHYGVTTWLKKHMSFSGSKVNINYVGKAGVKQKKTVSNSKIVSALKALIKDKKDNDPVFSTDDYTLNDNLVNKYLKKFDITAKDIRGLHANREVRDRLLKIKSKAPSDDKEKEKQRKEEFKKALEEAAKEVGHEPSTLKNQYLVPGFEDKYVSSGEVMGSSIPKASSFRLSIRADQKKKWIKDNVKEPKDSCFFYAAVMAILYPSLTLMRGKPQKKGETAHFFLKDKKGKIIDPTAIQYNFTIDYKGATEVDVTKNVDYVMKDDLFSKLKKEDQETIKKFNRKLSKRAALIKLPEDEVDKIHKIVVNLYARRVLGYASKEPFKYELVERTMLRREVEKDAAGGEKIYDLNETMEVPISMDIYDINPDIVPDKITLTVLDEDHVPLNDEGKPSYIGNWNSTDYVMKVAILKLITTPDSVEEYRRFKQFLKEVIEHEMRHVVQTFLSWSSQAKEDAAGLPSKHIMEEGFDTSGYPQEIEDEIKELREQYGIRYKEYDRIMSYDTPEKVKTLSDKEAIALMRERTQLSRDMDMIRKRIVYLQELAEDSRREHSLRDIEFHTNLGTQTSRFLRRVKPRVPRSALPDAIRLFVGLEPKEPYEYFHEVSPMFKALKKLNYAKWQTAVKLFISQVS